MSTPLADSDSILSPPALTSLAQSDGLGPPSSPVGTPTTAAPGAPNAGGAGGAAPPSPFGGPMMMMIFVMIGAMLLMSILGSRRDKKKREQMMGSLKKRDRVQTAGGIIGSIVELKPDTIVLKVDESSNTRITFSRASIQHVLDVADDKAGASE